MNQCTKVPAITSNDSQRLIYVIILAGGVRQQAPNPPGLAQPRLNRSKWHRLNTPKFAVSHRGNTCPVGTNTPKFVPYHSETKNQPKDRSFRPDVPADIRPKTSVRPSKSWKNKHFGTGMPRGRPRKNFSLKNFGLIFRCLITGDDCRLTYIQTGLCNFGRFWSSLNTVSDEHRTQRVFGPHRVARRELSEFRSAYYLCAKANSQSFSAELTSETVLLNHYSARFLELWPSNPCCFFWAKASEEPPKKARIVLSANPFTSLEQKGKTHKKARKIANQKEQGNRKKQKARIVREGTPKEGFGDSGKVAQKITPKSRFLVWPSLGNLLSRNSCPKPSFGVSFEWDLVSGASWPFRGQVQAGLSRFSQRMRPPACHHVSANQLPCANSPQMHQKIS